MNGSSAKIVSACLANHAFYICRNEVFIEFFVFYVRNVCSNKIQHKKTFFVSFIHVKIRVFSGIHANELVRGTKSKILQWNAATFNEMRGNWCLFMKLQKYTMNTFKNLFQSQFPLVSILFFCFSRFYI